MLIGSPKFNTSEQNLDKPAGAIFRCPLSSNIDDCERVRPDLTGNVGDEDKSDQWLGVRVASQGPGGIVGVSMAIPSHRYQHKPYSLIFSSMQLFSHSSKEEEKIESDWWLGVRDASPGEGVLRFGLDGGVPPKRRNPYTFLRVIAKKGTHFYRFFLK